MELLILAAALIVSMATVDLCPKSTYNDDDVEDNKTV